MAENTNMIDTAKTPRSENNRAVNTIADAILKAVDNRIQKARNDTSKQIKKTFSMNSIYQNVYPIGAVYLSVGSMSPHFLFGGTWEKIGDGTVDLDSDGSVVTVNAWKRTE